MPVLYSAHFLRVFLPLLAFAFALPGRAQTVAPAWSSASSVDISQPLAPNAVFDEAGNLYTATSFSSTVVVGGMTLTNQGGIDAYLAKFTPAGALAWVVPFATAGNENVAGLTLDAAGNAYVAGSFTNSISLGNGVSLTGTAGGPTKLFVARFSPQGAVQWAQQSSSASSAGQGIGVDAMGSVYVSGGYSSALTIGTGGPTITPPASTLPLGNYYLARLSAATGALQSLTPALQFERLSSSGPTTVFSPRIAVAPSGEVVLLGVFAQRAVFSGATLTATGLNDVLVAKFDAQGTFQWARQGGGPGEDRIYAGQIDAAGNVYVAGLFDGSASFDAASITASGGIDGFLVKYAAQGTMQWARSVGSASTDGWNQVALDAGGNPYVIGFVSGPTQVGSYAVTPAGGADALVVAYSPQGQVRWVQQAGGPGSDSGHSLSFTAGGDLRVSGTFQQTCTFGPLSVTTTASLGFYQARLANAALALRLPVAQPLMLYPNPAHDQLCLPALPSGTPLQFLDARGRVARETSVAAGTVSVRGLPTGLYFLRATDALGRPYTGRVLVD